MARGYKPGGTETGRRTKLFTSAQKEFNRELSKKLKQGSKTYIDKLDCIAIFREWNGRCAWCGLPLNVRGDKINNVHFMMLIPLAAGGKIKRDNIVTACYADKYENHRPIPQHGFDRIYNFNTLPDLIEQVAIKCAERATVARLKTSAEENEVRGELDKHEHLIQKSIDLLKRQIDNAIAEFVYTLHYKPITTYEIDHPMPVDGESTIGYAVAEIAEQVLSDEPETEEAKEIIADALQGINQTKQYRVLRRD